MNARRQAVIMKTTPKHIFVAFKNYYQDGQKQHVQSNDDMWVSHGHIIKFNCSYQMQSKHCVCRSKTPSRIVQHFSSCIQFDQISRIRGTPESKLYKRKRYTVWMVSSSISFDATWNSIRIRKKSIQFSCDIFGMVVLGQGAKPQNYVQRKNRKLSKQTSPIVMYCRRSGSNWERNQYVLRWTACVFINSNANFAADISLFEMFRVSYFFRFVHFKC